MLTPRPYQLDGRDFLAGRTHALLADQMRVGKTGQAVLAAGMVRARDTLVLCPAIAVPVWEEAWGEWGGPGQLTALSYDYAIRHPEIVRRPWDVFIADECHYARNPEAQRTKLTYGKDGAAWHATRTWALSGTPVLKHAGEIWAMGTAFGAIKATYKDFVHQYCRIDRLSLRPIGTKAHKINELSKLMSSFMLRRTRAQVAPEMPEITFNFLPIVGKPPAGAAFQGSDDDYLAWMERNAAHLAELRVATAMAKVQPLADNVAFALGNGLVDRAVIFGHHAEPIEAMAGALTARGFPSLSITGKTSSAQRAAAQAAFHAGKVPVLIGNVIAAGTAIDLSCASYGAFLELDWLSANNAQAASRLVSLTKREPVVLDVATWPGSFDDRMVRLLTRRSAEIAKLY